jgi:PAS domain S-box-containing protein
MIPVVSLSSRAHAAAVLFTGLAVGLRWALDPWFGTDQPFITVFAAVVLAAWAGGRGPALLSTVLGVLAVNLLFVLPRGELGFPDPSSLVAHLVYLTTCGLIILLAEHAERARRQRVEREQGLQLMIDALPMLVAYIDNTHRYRLNNRTYEHWFGLERDAIQGRHMREVLGEEAYAALLPLVTRALGGETVHLETEVPYQTAGTRQVGITYVPHRIDARVAGFFVLVEDISERRRAEHARAHLAAIVESTDDAVISKTLDGIITSWNAGAERLYGYTARDMIGHSIERIIPGDLLPEESRILEQLKRGERLHHFDTERLARDGRRIPVSLTISPVRNSAGRIIGVSKIARDISERRAAEQALRESEARFRTLADSAPMLIWRADTDNRGVWFNRAWLEFTGRTMEQELDQGWAAVLHPEDATRVIDTCTEHVARRVPFEIEFRMRREDGSFRWMIDRGVPMFDAPNGQFSGYLGSCVDITEHRLLQTRLRESVARLAESDRRKDEFLATLAHELRNPLAPILTAAQFLRRNATPESKLGSAGTIIERQTQHMTRLVDDLLDLSRITRGRIILQKERMNLELAIASAVEACQPRIDAAGHRLEIKLPAAPVYVEGDLTRLSQVIGNLLSNAVKYTPAGGDIRLILDSDGGDARLRVRDSGIGIRPDATERIFEMFAQVESALERSQGGLGIGLTLARQLVEMHGGRISVRSEGEGRGSEFEIRLPLGPSATADRPAHAAADGRRSAPARPLQILLADDNEDAAGSLTMLLQFDGHEVHTVHDGLAAVEAAARLQPDVVLLDIGMPELNGYEAARRIRSLPEGGRMQLIALTGWGQEEDRRSAQEAGFDAHFTKPIDLVALQRMLQRPVTLDVG